MKAVGYWKSTKEPNLPEPFGMVGHYNDQELKTKIIKYLKSGNIYVQWRGFSNCRFKCDPKHRALGTKCLSDGVYVWPEGFYHYIEKHNIILPEAFLEHIKNNNFQVPKISFGEYGDGVGEPEYNYTEWLEGGTYFDVGK